ncbi:hypothetical protein [Pseudomonas caspiana]|uniref:Uncharacterized protein n=1 Tax=Pseudomonas caspiana TaxID=1451454 RepID=A0A1Y3P4E1_9PSED|nr:hypothetical protein [Pseudomonas caspiana]OUM71654.1 hypothetical protein AUC60_22075 [Pseudomonas caspiana]
MLAESESQYCPTDLRRTSRLSMIVTELKYPTLDATRADTLYSSQNIIESMPRFHEQVGLHVERNGSENQPDGFETFC